MRRFSKKAVDRASRTGDSQSGSAVGGDDKKTEIAAVRLLARREHSTRDLTRKLQGKGHSRDAVERVVTKLSDKELVSDERFAASFVAEHARRGHGPVRIRAELRQQGANDALIEAALARSGFDWVRIAAQVRLRKFGTVPPASVAERAKQARFLQYRGFTTDQLRGALSGMDDEAGDESSSASYDPEWSD